VAEDATLALQTGIYTQLSAGGSGLSGITLYDNVPADAAMPYIRICSVVQSQNWRTTTTKGQNVYAQFDVWSDSTAGSTECKTWLNLLSVALTATAVTATGWSVIDQLVGRTDTVDLSTPEGHLYHGILEMQYHLQEV